MHNYFVLKSFEYSQALTEGDICLEYHQQTLSASPETINTRFDEVVGVIPAGLGSSAYTMSTDGVVTAGSDQGGFANINTVDVTSTVIGSEISFFILGKPKPIDA